MRAPGVRIALASLAFTLVASILAAQTAASGNWLPDAPSVSIAPAAHYAEPPYRPLAPHEKFHGFVHHTISPYTLLGAAYDASWSQAWGDPRDYGGGMEGWGKRLGAAAAGSEARSFFGTFLFPALLHQDPRYFSMDHGPVLKRGLHGVERLFVTRNDAGKEVFNASGMLAIAFTESLGMAWTPERERSAGTAFVRILGAMQGNAIDYVLREFTPDFLRFFKHHAPKPLQRLEQRMYLQHSDDTNAP